MGIEKRIVVETLPSLICKRRAKRGIGRWRERNQVDLGLLRPVRRKNYNRPVANQPQAQFSIGQLVEHRLFGYRGAVFDVDPVFLGDDDWYEQVARSRPPKDKPWYKVLVHGAEHTTYVAERNLRADASGEAIEHPALWALFIDFEDGRYTTRMPTA
jgi:heat shock protein HspQ